MRRRVGLFLVCGFVLPLICAGNASAQSSSLIITPPTPRAGDVVTVTGSGYSSAGGVDLRINTRDATPIGNTSVDTAGRLSPATVRIPASLAPGWYLLIATQTTAQGRHRGFTPGRAKLRVVPASARAGGGAGGSPGGGPTTGLLIAALTLTVLAGSTMLIVRRKRTPNRPLGDNAGISR